MIKGTTKILGVIGHPIAHSLSPAMHNAAISHLGVDFVYLAFPVKPEDLEVAISGFGAIGIRGFSITIPHKQAILPLLSEVSPIARSIGAVNTVYLTDKGWCGTNTDVEGFLAPLRRVSTGAPPLQSGENSLKVPLLSPLGGVRDLGGSPGADWSQKVAVILGNGGAARAVVAGCAQLGCAQIHVIGRNEQNLAEFQQSWLNSAMPVKNLQVHTWDNLSSLISQADLLVNTTPVGMYPHGEKSPVDAAAIDRISPGAIAYDLIYNPSPTQFLTDAQRMGARTIDGLEMLVQQGAAALKIWLDRESVPVDVMRTALQKNLGLK
ncbi:MAG: shikimate dehydrogenase [Microcoleus sp. CSU_2_2]|nr:shikimate dehydrogenase [Microcoleus sp. SU_5_3]NJS11720.1 shikimate dehydrogenase [Microcoleus sp. CSU_2_2]